VNPFSSIFAIATATRNRLYDRGALRSRRLSRAVISVGNISSGGSGKTPFVILLGQLLKQRGIEFDVLSRGYGRTTQGVFEVNPKGSPDQFGDEPLLIARHLACPVIVGESRYNAGMLAERRYNTSLHILDDGFQHRSLARDFDIVLLAPEDMNDQLLPAGRLREPPSSLARADAIVITGELDIGRLPADKYVWRLRRGVSVAGAPANPVVFCGIARPRKFIEQLSSAGIQPVAQKFYRDHYRYSLADVQDLLTLRDQRYAHGFITTEKDAINLGDHAAQLAPLIIAEVEAELSEAADALDTILRVIAERRAKP
jgi:tetraacyldisaccharide 4'-kinase